MAFLLFGCGVAILFFALIQLTAGLRQPLTVVMVVGCAAAAYVMLYLWAADTGLLLRVPALANSDNAAVLVSVPALYLSSLTLLHEGRRPVRSYAVYFVGPVALAVASVVFGALNAPSVLVARGALPGHRSSLLLILLTLASDLSLVAAVVLALVAARRLFLARGVHDRAGFRHQVAFLFAYLTSSTIIVAGSATARDPVYEIGCLMTGLIMVCFAVSRTAVFYFAHDRRLSPPRTHKREWDRSAEELSTRLASLMEREAPCRDENLSLRRLAGMIGEEPRRLSYHLNIGRTRSFRSYINELRLEAVCRDLASDRYRSILEIAFANGFSSKSSFNALFFKRYGQTPRELRRKRLRHVEGGSN